MEASTGPPRLPTPPNEQNIEKIKLKLLHKGVNPTPKIIHTLRKKELQKSLRKSKHSLASQPQPLTDSQKQSIAEETQFQALKSEYKNFMKSIEAGAEDGNGVSMVGKPWERMGTAQLMKLASASREHGGEKLKSEHLRELSEILERDRDEFRWLLDDDIELEEGWLEEKRNWVRPKRRGGDAETIRFLVDKLSSRELGLKDWKFSRMMKLSGLHFTEGQLIKIVEGLGNKGKWRHALSVVEWVYSSKEHRHYKSRFVYTKLLAVLGKARRPHEALRIFDLMREDCQIYPDMAAYRSIAVTLGQGGLLKELLDLVECMREKPAKRIKNMRYKSWDPILQPDVVVFNAVLNACVPSRQWKGVSWVFEQLRKNGLKPNGATYGLAMEVMLQSGKYDLVHEFFVKMRRSGEAPKALTYKVLVKAFWEEGRVDEAIQAVRDMEQRGVIGTACVYYELACCLCNNGRWQEAMTEVAKLEKVPHTKPLEVTFTGMIMSSMDGGHFHDCISIFEHVKDRCALDIGIINAMLKVYGRNDMFSQAKELFEECKQAKSDPRNSLDDFGSSLGPDAYTYGTILETSASAQQWEYFEYVYREMALSGYLLDQSKHTWLLVEASKAGKWYLLEHAFDTMLEAGEIPHITLFTELICQAVIQEDYERAVNIINIMAYAPFQVSEKQWTGLFEKNGDRFRGESLKELLETLRYCDLPSEATVSNLTKSLTSYCQSDNWKEISIVNPEASSNTDFCKALHANSERHDDTFRVDHSSIDRGGDADSELFGFSNHDCNSADPEANLHVTTDESADDSVDKFLNYIERGNSDSEEVELDFPTGDESDSPESSLPSSDEILEFWKESRKSDGFFFPFQFRGK